MWVLREKDANSIIGICGLHHSEDYVDKVELSYMLFPDYWGKGFATEAVSTCINYAFKTLILNDIIAITQKAYTNSVNLLKKMGMQHIDTFNKFNATQQVYQLIKADWLKNEENDLT